MLAVRLRMEFAPPALDEASAVLRSLVGPVRAEPGCVATRLLLDADNHGAITFLEDWRDGGAFERHLHEMTFRRLLAVMDLAANAPVLEIDEVVSRRGIDYLEELIEGR